MDCLPKVSLVLLSQVLSHGIETFSLSSSSSSSLDTFFTYGIGGLKVSSLC